MTSTPISPQNGIDASPVGLPVYLDVSCDGLQGRIEVVDSGTGMSPQFVRDGLFKPFVSTKESGFGLGAFEALGLARAMGGSIEVASEPGKGSDFTLWLPLADTHEDAGTGEPIGKVA